MVFNVLYMKVIHSVLLPTLLVFYLFVHLSLAHLHCFSTFNYNKKYTTTRYHFETIVDKFPFKVLIVFKIDLHSEM